METIKVNKTELEAAVKKIWNGYSENVSSRSAEENAQLKTECFEKMNQFEIVLEYPPQHPNPDINLLINRLCDDSRIKEGVGVVYSGGSVGGMYIESFGRPRIQFPETADWVFIKEWCDGYREVWINEKECVTVTICEGDLTVVICKDQAAFARQIAGAIKCYGQAERVHQYELLNHDEKFRYMMLSRLKSDCEYYLGNGSRSSKHLWAKDESEQIETMKALHNSFDENEKPEWLTWDEILDYERKMI